MFEDTFKNRIRLGCAVTASLFFLNAFLATSQIIFYLSIVEGVFALLFSIRLPTPLPPPPSLDVWKDMPKAKDRESKNCSHCGKAVDDNWTMCPYCSKRI
tara:strand:- start:1642 stop:1941 length:300 start_codon:yes stop_codon:yes gene_type:complete